MNLVTYDEAIAHLRADHYADAEWMSIWIPAVSEMIRAYMKDEWRLYVPARDDDGCIIRDDDGNPVPEMRNGKPIVLHQAKVAALLELANQYRFREGEGGNRGLPDEYGFALCRAAVSVLAPLRCPTIA